MEAIFMKRKAIFMGLIVLMCSGNQAHAGVQPVVTGIFNASWSTLAKQGAMVAAGVAVIGGLTYYLFSLKKNYSIVEIKDNNSSNTWYIQCTGLLGCRYYKKQVINGVTKKERITKEVFNKKTGNFNSGFSQSPINFNTVAYFDHRDGTYSKKETINGEVVLRKITRKEVDQGTESSKKEMDTFSAKMDKEMAFFRAKMSGFSF